MVCPFHFYSSWLKEGGFDRNVDTTLLSSSPLLVCVQDKTCICIGFFPLDIERFAGYRIMGAAALQKYIGSLGGIGTPGVGSSSSYAPKELNKEIMPDKVSLFST